MEWHEARRCRVTGTKLQHIMGTPLARRQLIAELIAEKATEQSKIYRATAEMERGNAEEMFAIRAYEDLTGKKVEQPGMCIHDEADWLANSPDGLIANDKGVYTEAIEVKSPDSKKAILYRIENMVPMKETGLLTSFTKAEIMEVLDEEGIEYDPKSKVTELEALLPAGQEGKPSATAPWLGIPSEYKWQVVNYFLVNKDLERLHFIVWDPRFIQEDQKLYIVTVERDNKELQKAVGEAITAIESFRKDWMRWEEMVLPDNF